MPWRFANYPALLSVLTSIFEGVFGLRWTTDALTAHVNSPWPAVSLSHLQIRGARLDLTLQEDGTLVAVINGREAARSQDRKLRLGWEMFA